MYFASVFVCRQLMLLIDLYSQVEVHDHILPIAFLLVDDCVYQVRIMALRVVSYFTLSATFVNCWTLPCQFLS